MRRIMVVVLWIWMLTCWVAAPPTAAAAGHSSFDPGRAWTTAHQEIAPSTISQPTANRLMPGRVRLRSAARLHTAANGGEIVGEVPASGLVRVLDGPRYDRYFVAAGTTRGWVSASKLSWTILGDPRDTALYPLAALSVRAATIVADNGSRLSVAVYDPVTNRTYVDGTSGPIAGASLSKTLLATVALEQIEQGQLGDTEAMRQALISMIVLSDNDAANAVWSEIGGATTVASFLMSQQLEGFHLPDRWDWGAISATAPSWSTFLAMLGSGRILNSEHTAFLLGLMEDQIVDHRWGVLTPGDDRLSIGKNGWYLDESTVLDWRVNSAGFVATREQRRGIAPLVVVVLSRYPGEYGMSWGVDLAADITDAVLTIDAIPAEPTRRSPRVFRLV